MDNASIPEPHSGVLGQTIMALRVTLDNMQEKATELVSALSDMQLSSNFPEKQHEAIIAMTALRKASSGDLGTRFRMIGTSFDEQVYQTFEGFCEDCPITSEGLAKVSEFLPTDQLSQFRYLALYEYAHAMHLTKSPRDIIDAIHPHSLMYTAPDDMHARTILTRTYWYLQSLKEQGEIEWFYSSIHVISEFGDTFDHAVMDELNEIEDALTSDMLQKVAADSEVNPALEKNLNMSIDAMKDSLTKIIGFIGNARGILHIYDELAQCIIESNKTIQAAYKIYLETNAIDF